MRVGITGGSGFLGWHLRCRLLPTDWSVSIANRESFTSPETLSKNLDGCDAVVHLAGINRPSGTAHESDNYALATTLVEALKRTESRPHLVFANSIKSGDGTPYGQSKEQSHVVFSDWASSSGAPYTNVLLPNVFGEGGRPHYNSVVATFCWNLTRGESCTVHKDKLLSLVHAQDVVGRMMECITQGVVGDATLDTRQITVSQVLAELQTLYETYTDGVCPDLTDAFRRDLFNTLRSHMFPNRYPIRVDVQQDSRGRLTELVRNRGEGQTFMSTTEPGAVRGNHFHLRKLERFLVIQGEAKIAVRRLLQNSVNEFLVSGRDPAYVDMPTMHAHNIRNVGEGPLITLFWTSEILDPSDTDTFHEDV